MFLPVEIPLPERLMVLTKDPDASRALGISLETFIEYSIKRQEEDFRNPLMEVFKAVVCHLPESLKVPTIPIPVFPENTESLLTLRDRLNTLIRASDQSDLSTLLFTEVLDLPEAKPFMNAVDIHFLPGFALGTDMSRTSLTSITSRNVLNNFRHLCFKASPLHFQSVVETAITYNSSGLIKNPVQWESMIKALVRIIATDHVTTVNQGAFYLYRAITPELQGDKDMCMSLSFFNAWTTLTLNALTYSVFPETLDPEMDLANLLAIMPFTIPDRDYVASKPPVQHLADSTLAYIMYAAKRYTPLCLTTKKSRLWFAETQHPLQEFLPATYFTISKSTPDGMNGILGAVVRYYGPEEDRYMYSNTLFDVLPVFEGYLSTMGGAVFVLRILNRMQAMRKANQSERNEWLHAESKKEPKSVKKRFISKVLENFNSDESMYRLIDTKGLFQVFKCMTIAKKIVDNPILPDQCGMLRLNHVRQLHLPVLYHYPGLHMINVCFPVTSATTGMLLKMYGYPEQPRNIFGNASVMAVMDLQNKLGRELLLTYLECGYATGIIKSGAPFRTMSPNHQQTLSIICSQMQSIYDLVPPDEPVPADRMYHPNNMFFVVTLELPCIWTEQQLEGIL